MRIQRHTTNGDGDALSRVGAATLGAPGPDERRNRRRRRRRPRHPLAWLAVMLILIATAAAFAQFAMRVEPDGAPRLRCQGPPCVQVDGRIVYVQRRDPDGDGDLHVVLLSRQSVTAPLVSAL